MLIEVTYACKMGCTHCMSDCKPDGMYMSLQTFNDTLDFLIKYHIPTWNFSGGEVFEHPDILEMLTILESKWKQTIPRYPLTFATNGRELVRNKDIYHTIKEMQKRNKDMIFIQVTDDKRFYPSTLTSQEKYWLKKIDAIIDTVPGNLYDAEQ